MYSYDRSKTAAEDDPAGLVDDLRPFLGEIEDIENRLSKLKREYAKKIFTKHAPLGLNAKNNRALASYFRDTSEKINDATESIRSALADASSVMLEAKKEQAKFRD